MASSDADGLEGKVAKLQLSVEVLGGDPVNVNGPLKGELGRKDSDLAGLSFESELEGRVARASNVRGRNVEDGGGQSVESYSSKNWEDEE